MHHLREQWRQATLKSTTAAYVWKSTMLPPTPEELAVIIAEEGLLSHDEAQKLLTSKERKDGWKFREIGHKALYQRWGNDITLKHIPGEPAPPKPGPDTFDYELYEVFTGQPHPEFAYAASLEEE